MVGSSGGSLSPREKTESSPGFSRSAITTFGIECGTLRSLFRARAFLLSVITVLSAQIPVIVTDISACVIREADVTCANIYEILVEIGRL